MGYTGRGAPERDVAGSNVAGPWATDDRGVVAGPAMQCIA